MDKITNFLYSTVVMEPLSRGKRYLHQHKHRVTSKTTPGAAVDSVKLASENKRPTNLRAHVRPLSRAEVRAAKRANTPRWKRWLKRAVVSLVIFTLLGSGAGIAVFAYFANALPSPDQITNRTLAESTKIYDRTGEHLLYETGKNIRRTYVSLDQISPLLKNATIALEDKNFYKHPGFDPLAIVRTVWIDVIKQKKYGASTITQQFAGNAVTGREKNYTRKIKELIFSIELERRYNKDQILEWYLNENSYGGVNHGVEAAAQTYFNKSAKDVTLAEAAALASIPQAPTYYTDTDNLTDLTSRRNYALDRMVEEGYATNEEVETAKTEPITLNKVLVAKDAPHFVDYVSAQLEDDFGNTFVDKGLKVTTTLDYDKQKIAEEQITKGMAVIEKNGGSNAALVTIDTKTGQVLVMIGSKNYYDENYDGQVNIATSLNQPGSSFKPIVYLTAFANGYNPNTILFDVETDFPTESGNYHPHNYDLSTHGPLAMRNTLAMSLNIPAVKTMYLVGKNRVLDTATTLGYSTFSDHSQFGLASALGSGDVKLLEHTSAFATLAREGERHPVATILKVEDRQGNVLYEWHDTSSQVVDKTAVQMLNSVLSTPANRNGMFGALNIPGKTLAAKTGTTNDFKDAWAMGYTPSFATGVWTGNNAGNVSMNRGADGSIIAAPIMIGYMKQILENLPDEKFSNMPTIKANKPVLQGQASTTEKKYVDKVTQHVISDECVASYPPEFRVQKEFKEAHTILYYLKKEDPAGAAPAKPESDPMYKSWEDAVQLWAGGQPEYLSDKTEYEDCELRSIDQTPIVTITYPTTNTKLTKSTFNITISIKAGTGRSIKQIEYLIDNQRVDLKTKSPFDSTYTGTGLTSGNHTLTIRATNDRDNLGTASVKFSFDNESTTNNNNANSNKNANKNSNSGNINRSSSDGN